MPAPPSLIRQPLPVRTACMFQCTSPTLSGGLYASPALQAILHPIKACPQNRAIWLQTDCITAAHFHG